MANSLKPVRVAPKGMGLYDFVAHQEGFFAAEGLDVEFDWKTFRGTQSSWKGLEYFQRPQDRPYTQDKREVIQGDDGAEALGEVVRIDHYVGGHRAEFSGGTSPIL